MGSVIGRRRGRGFSRKWQRLDAELQRCWNDGLQARQIVALPQFAAFTAQAIWSRVLFLRHRGVALHRHEEIEMPNSPWTAERLEILVRCWNEGISANEIALRPEFPGISRNAIIGKITRLRIAGVGLRNVGPTARQPRRAHAPRISNIARQRSVRVTAPRAKFRQPPVPPHIHALGFVDHPETACHWIVAGEGAAALWCDQPKVFGSYCPFHDAVAHDRPTADPEASND